MIKSTILLLATAALMSCSSGETDGRKYSANNASPIAGKMGVSYRRVQVDNPPPVSDTPSQPKTIESDGLLGVLTSDNSNDPPGLLDRVASANTDEPGASYWMHGQQSPNPVASKMGVRVTRRKK